MWTLKLRGRSSRTLKYFIDSFQAKEMKRKTKTLNADRFSGQDEITETGSVERALQLGTESSFVITVGTVGNE